MGIWKKEARSQETFPSRPPFSRVHLGKKGKEARS